MEESPEMMFLLFHDSVIEPEARPIHSLACILLNTGSLINIKWMNGRVAKRMKEMLNC